MKACGNVNSPTNAKPPAPAGTLFQSASCKRTKVVQPLLVI